MQNVHHTDLWIQHLLYYCTGNLPFVIATKTTPHNKNSETIWISL